ncbi:ead/Ea22-like family protein [Klebsiella pneumoniae]
MTNITELAQSLKAEGISPERMEWLKKLADMKYCASNPGHWLMSLKETNYLAVVALKCIENNLALVEALEKAQAKADVYDMLRDDYGLREKGVGLADFVDWQAKRIAELESRTVKMPHRNLGHPKLFLLCPFPYYDAEDMEKALAAAGIRVEAE